MFARTKLVLVLLCLALRVCTGTQCMRCAPGKFKSADMLFTPCTLCPENTFSAVPGAAQCTPCPPFSSSVMGSSRCTFEPCRGEDYSTGCVCPVGTTGPDSGPCAACAVGTFKNRTGAAPCQNCSGNMTSVARSGTCFCPNGTALVDGACASIYREGVRLCGVFKIDDSNATNNSNSTNIDIDAMIRQIRSSIASQYNISESLVQVSFSSSNTDSDYAGLRHLLHESEYHFDVLIMTRSKEELARVVNLTATEPPRILEEVERTVLAVSVQEGAVVLCPPNEVSTGKACVCAAGYTRCAKCGKCLACAQGLAKSQGGDAACDTCTNNTFSRTGAVQCSACPFSAVTKDNHTSCSCNPAFVFFRDTCTPTESVYLNLTGVVKLREGEFTDSELQQILVDGFSAYLDYSKEFITIIINRNAIATNDTSNSTYRRRLLNDLPVEFDYTALMRVEKNDKETYEKIKNISAEAKNQVISITDAAGNQIDVGAAALQDSYLRNDGKPLDACPDGRQMKLDLVQMKNVCEDPPPPPGGPNMHAAIGGGVGGGVFVLVILAIGIWWCCCRGKKNEKAKKQEEEKKQETQPLIVPELPLGLHFQQRQQNTNTPTRPAKLQVPATVSFEYHLLPGQSI